MANRFHCDNCDKVMTPPFLNLTIQVVQSCAPPMKGTYVDRHATNLQVCGTCTIADAVGTVARALLKPDDPEAITWSCESCHFSNLNGFADCGHCGMNRKTL